MEEKEGRMSSNLFVLRSPSLPPNDHRLLHLPPLPPSLQLTSRTLHILCAPSRPPTRTLSITNPPSPLSSSSFPPSRAQQGSSLPSLSPLASSR